jgi:hypothetical protein
MPPRCASFAGVEPVQMGLPELETLQHHEYVQLLERWNSSNNATVQLHGVS